MSHECTWAACVLERASRAVRRWLLGCVLITFPATAQQPGSAQVFQGCYRIDIGPWQIDGQVVPDPSGPLPKQMELTLERASRSEHTPSRFLMRAKSGVSETEFADTEWWISDTDRLVVRWANPLYGIIAEVRPNGERENDKERLSGEARAWGDELSPKWPRSVLTMTPVDCR